MKNYSDSLIQLFQLVDDMSPEFESNILSNGKKVSPTGIKDDKDFIKVYNRTLKEYQKRYPGASEEQFRNYSADRLTRRIEAIRKDVRRDDDLISWTEIYINDYLRADRRAGIYSELYNELIKNNYIACRPEVFDHVMEHKELPPGSRNDKIRWLTARADATYFADNFDFGIKQLSDCFIDYRKEKPSNRPFDGNDRSEISRKPPLPDIVKKHSDPKTDPEKA
jgi:hypothetical protein